MGEERRGEERALLQPRVSAKWQTKQTVAAVGWAVGVGGCCCIHDLRQKHNKHNCGFSVLFLDVDVDVGHLICCFVLLCFAWWLFATV